MGLLNILCLFDEDDGVCVDIGVEEGGEVLFYYDLMIVKVIIYDYDWVFVVYLMVEVLEEFVVWLVKMNGGFLCNCVLYFDFLDEKLMMGFIGECEVDLILLCVDLVVVGFVVLIFIFENGDGSDYVDLFVVVDGWCMNMSVCLGDCFEVGEEIVLVVLSLYDEDMSVSIGDEILLLEGIDGSGGEEGYFFQVVVDDVVVSVEVDFLEEGYLVFFCGYFEFYVFLYFDVVVDVVEVGGVIKVFMFGKVFVLNVFLGDIVIKGQVLVVLEVMKMEYFLLVLCDGVIGEVVVLMGDQVVEGDIFVVMQEEMVEV